MNDLRVTIFHLFIYMSVSLIDSKHSCANFFFLFFHPRSYFQRSRGTREFKHGSAFCTSAQFMFSARQRNAHIFHL
jgi:hypothetical protein